MARKSLSSLSSLGAEEPTPQSDTTEKAKPAAAAAAATTAPAAPATIEPEIAAAPKPPRRSQPAAKRSTTSADGGEGGPAVKGVPVHLTEEINERLQAHMARTRRSHQTVLMDAIESTYSRLADLVAESTLTDEDAERTPLFDRTPTRPAPTATGQARFKHTVRMTDRNRKILDDITEQVGAPSRNFLITVAYEAYLPTIEKS